MLRRFLCLALVAAAATRAAAAPPPVPQKNWLQLETPNFRVIGSAGERDLRRAATRLEQFRETLGILFPKAVLVSSVPTTVIVFRGDKEYRPFKPLYNGKPKEISGFFLPGRTVNYVTMAAAGVEEFGIVYHEYVHLVVNNTLQGTPLWFNEGLADYYATFEVTGGGRQASLGRIQSNHILRLREQWMPIGELVKVGHDSPYYNESDKMSVFYAESWALVHYLLLGHEGQYAKGIGTFVADLANGKSLDDASGRAFSLTAAALEREVRRYVDGERFVRQVVTFTTKVGAIDDVPVSPLAPASAHAALGDLLFRMDRPDEARAQLDAALALAPALPDAHAALGRMLLALNDKDEAVKHLEQAAAAPDASWAAHFDYATLLIDARTAGAGTPERDKTIERELRRTIELQPAFPDALVQLAWMISQSSAGLDEAMALVKRGLALSPGNEHFWLLLAELYGAKDDWASVRLIATRLSGAADASVRGRSASLLATATASLERERQSPVRRATAPAADPGGPGPAPAPVLQPLFRKPAAGELRFSGVLTEIQCSASGAIGFLVRGRDGPMRFEASGFDALEFISYRADLSGRIECGRQRDPVVIVTYAPAAEGRAARVIAIEFVPQGYEPK